MHQIGSVSHLFENTRILKDTTSLIDLKCVLRMSDFRFSQIQVTLEAWPVGFSILT